MKNWWPLYLRLNWDRRILIASVVLALIPVLAMYLTSAKPESAAPLVPFQTDTHIPKGFVLVPIEAQNYEALDSILGRFGYVDLYQGGATGMGKQRLVARNVRILRAPQNPSHFAVLIPEAQAPKVLEASGAFTVIVKRPAETGTEFVKEASTPKRSITYGGG